MDALNHWLTKYMPATRYVSRMDHVGGFDNVGRYSAAGIDPYEWHREAALKKYKTLDLSQMKRFAALIGHTDVESTAAARKIVQQNKEKIIKVIISDMIDGNISLFMVREAEWFKATKIHIPPRAFWGRHPGFQQALLQNDTEQLRRVSDP